MAKKIYVDNVVADAIHTMEQQTQELDFEQRETRKRLDALSAKGVKDLTQRFGELETKLDQVEGLERKVVELAEVLNAEEKRRDRELEAMERRWAGEVCRVEDTLEETMEERFEEQDRKLAESQLKAASDLNSHIEESLKRLHNDIRQDWWVADLERRDKVWTEELKRQLKEHPTHKEVAQSYTMLGVTSNLIDQVGQLHTKTGRDHHLLQSELNTMERLYLRQLDTSAPVVSCLIHKFSSRLY